jgi:hypothetical protein
MQTNSAAPVTAQKPALISLVLLSLALNACSARRCCKDDNTLRFKLDAAQPAAEVSGKQALEEVGRFKVFPKKELLLGKSRQVFSAFGIDENAKPEDNGATLTYRAKDGGVLVFNRATAEISYFNGAREPWKGRELKEDKDIKRISDSLMHVLFNEKAEGYYFTNPEKTLKASREDTVLRPIYYFGRYVPVMNSRFVLGTTMHVRLGFGSDSKPMYLAARDMDSSTTGKDTVPTPTSVRDSLARWSKSRTRPFCLKYMNHPDHPYIVDLSVRKILRTYVEVAAPPDSSDTLHVATTALVPRVTVIAEARLRRMAPPQPNETTFPKPDPLYLFFHFPCTPEAGLCWPDGQHEMELPGVPKRATCPSCGGIP